MFFSSWYDILRVIIVGTLGYIALVALLRVSGKRTLSKMNMFDFVVTVALGSTFATLLLSKDVTLAEGTTALALLILLQYIVAWLSVRSKRFRRIVKGDPTLLLFRGEYLHDTMKAERIAAEEVRFAVRSHGFDDMSEVGAVVLETDGTLTVVPDVAPDATTSLADVNLSSHREKQT
jgi:uncharacterized membrane protein YcaP (DUF421 family)